MFNYDCVILKDSLDLRGKLVDMGYKMTLSAGDVYDALIATKKAVIGAPLIDTYQDGVQWTLSNYLEGNPRIYNCEDNEDLFIALAACSSDGLGAYRWLRNSKTGGWVQWTDETRDKLRFSICDYLLPTKEEIIKHFGGKPHNYEEFLL